MTKCLEKVGCTKCGSSDGLQTFMEDDKISGYCFACSTYFDDPYNGGKPDVKSIKRKTPEEIAEEIQEVRGCGYAPLYRSIKPAFWKKYGVRSSCNPYTGKPNAVIWHPLTKAGKLVGYKAKSTAKKMQWILTNEKEFDLYGWEVARRTGARTLYITEGEEDALALDQIISENNTGNFANQHAVVSLPNGTKSVSVLGRQAADIKRIFQEVVLVFDNDEPGQKAVTEALRYISTAKTVILPEKDANDCLKLGKSKEAFNQLTFRKTTAKPSGLVTFEDVEEDLYKVAEMGDSTPWPMLTEWLRGLHVGVYGIAGGEGGGKTTFVHEMIAHNLQQGISNIAIMLEEEKGKTFINVGSKIIGRDMSAPDKGITDGEKDVLRPLFKDKLFVFDVEQDRSATALEFADHVVELATPLLDTWEYLWIDNMTKVTESIPSAAERNDFISTFVAKMDTFARRNGKKIFILSHFNKQKKDEVPYSEGGRGNLNQIAGGAGLQRYAEGIFFIERNTQGVDASCIKFRIAKNRQGRQTGVIKMKYESVTTRVGEVDWDDNLFITKK